MRKLLVALLILWAVPCWAATYYIDNGAANNSANGTTSSTPWTGATRTNWSRGALEYSLTGLPTKGFITLTPGKGTGAIAPGKGHGTISPYYDDIIFFLYDLKYEDLLFSPFYGINNLINIGVTTSRKNNY